MLGEDESTTPAQSREGDSLGRDGEVAGTAGELEGRKARLSGEREADFSKPFLFFCGACTTVDEKKWNK